MSNMSHTIQPSKPARVAVDLKCRLCGAHVVLKINPSDFWDWKQGKKLIQDAFPYLNDDQREMLKSQTCPDCWEEMFGDE